MINIACPNCREYLQKDGAKYLCPSCNISYPLSDNIIDTRKGDEPYWCEVSQERMSRLIDQMKSERWDKSLKNLCEEIKDMALYNVTVDDDRANWLYFIPIERDSVVLDAGSGWGAVTFSLARHFKHVVSLDSVLERIKFINARKSQDNVDNIQCVCGSALKLPFKDETFDLVVLNGVLEWTGLSDLSISPYEVQLNVLKEINRVLKPGGYIYIGIENRYGIDYFLGFRDHHSKLKYSTIMPRFMADIYSKLMKGRPYRTYTHSYSGYKRLLNKASFRKHQFYFPVSNYRKFHYLIPLAGTGPLEFALNELLPEKLLFTSRLAKRMFLTAHFMLKLKLTFLIKYFVTSYSIVSEKPNVK